MASKGKIDVAINALPQEMRVPLRDAFYHVMDGWKVGNADRAENAQWYRLTARTSSVAFQEFAVAHGLGTTPLQVFPVLDLTQIGSQLVNLQVSRAPDAQFLYLRSPSTSAVVTLLVEP
jgi:hypothetical protein